MISNLCETLRKLLFTYVYFLTYFLRFRKHRALKIWKPTTELSGIYRCKVSSFVDEDFMQRRMIVYGNTFLIFWYGGAT